MPKRLTTIIWALALATVATCSVGLTAGCAVKAIHRETQPLELNETPVRAVIENGDWVVIRGVTGPDNFIGTVTNMPFSHASVYDLENDEVIEADSHGVHRTPLIEYLGSASRVWIVKPVWATPETRPLAVKLARSLVGRPYDFTGLIGLGLKDSYYCSELAIAVWRPFMGEAEVNAIPLVISPGRLHHWGRVVYDSMEIGLGQVPPSEKEPQ
ncbi:MAG: hypothetical protein LBF58_02070 [Deltaproteobacteria bacterium]|jgi:hypothetical protein|nr:hypothetical protein [Deltaproteobacteria bacterium]